MLPHQLDVIGDRESATKVMTGGYRSAKTVTGVGCIFEMGMRALTTGETVDGLIVGPTFRFVNDVIVRNLQNFLTLWKVPHTYHKSDKIMTIGRRRRFDVFCRSADDPRAMEGITAGWLWGDEWELWDPEALTTAFGRVSKGPVQQKLLTGTPEGHGPCFDIVFGRVNMRLVRSGPRYAVYRSDDNTLTQWLVESEANTTLTEKYLDEMRKALDDDAADEKLKGIRRAKGGRVYSRFNREIHTGHPCVVVGDGTELQVWADFNVGKMVWVVAETSKAAKACHIVGEFVGKNTDTARQAEEIKEYLAKHLTKTRGRTHTVGDVTAMGIPVWCDASGAQRTAVTALTHVALINQAGFEAQHGLKNPLIDDRVNTVQVMLRDRRLTVDAAAAPNVMMAFERQAYAPNGQPDKTGGLDAAADAIGYGCHFQFPAWRAPSVPDHAEPLPRDEWGVR